MENSILAIITARGGSKRIPKKNIKLFCGKPIISYSIEAALKSNLFEEVMVSTEDENISQISKSFGATVPFLRSDRTADDFATTSDVILEVLENYTKRGRFFQYVCCIYPTAPFITSERLVESFLKLRNSSADVVFPVVKFSYPPQRGFIEQDGGLEFVDPKYMDSRSQDLTPIYHDAGQFYSFKALPFLENGKLLSGRIGFIELSELEVQDIDNDTDWMLAEMKYKLLKNLNDGTPSVNSFY